MPLTKDNHTQPHLTTTMCYHGVSPQVSDDEVLAAAEAACIHEAITTRFPKVWAS